MSPCKYTSASWLFLVLGVNKHEQPGAAVGKGGLGSLLKCLVLHIHPGARAWGTCLLAHSTCEGAHATAPGWVTDLWSGAPSPHVRSYGRDTEGKTPDQRQMRPRNVGDEHLSALGWGTKGTPQTYTERCSHTERQLFSCICAPRGSLSSQET